MNPVDTGEMWECPDFFPLGGKHVLLISTMGKVRWKVGTYAKQRFVAEKEGVVDWGAYYAAKTMVDAEGNRILWGWITETRPDADLIAAGWAGAMSLPRVLSLNSDYELEMKVATAAQKLRGAHTSLAPALQCLRGGSFWRIFAFAIWRRKLNWSFARSRRNLPFICNLRQEKALPVFPSRTHLAAANFASTILPRQSTRVQMDAGIYIYFSTDRCSKFLSTEPRLLPNAPIRFLRGH